MPAAGRRNGRRCAQPEPRKAPGAADGLAKLARAFAERDRAAAEAVEVTAAVSAPLIDELKAALPAPLVGGTK